MITSQGKQYICFNNDVKTAQEAQCTKSRSLSKLVDTILNIGFFEHKCVSLKGYCNMDNLNKV